MHIVISADPKCAGRYCKKHEKFVSENPELVKMEWVHYLSQFPSKLHLDTEIGHVKE